MSLDPERKQRVAKMVDELRREHVPVTPQRIISRVVCNIPITRLSDAGAYVFEALTYAGYEIVDTGANKDEPATSGG